MHYRPLVLATLISLASAAEQPLVPENGKVDRLLLFCLGGAGTSERVAEGVCRERHDGNLFDLVAGCGLDVRLPEVLGRGSVIWSGGTDPYAEDEFSGLVDLSVSTYKEGWFCPFYRVRLGAGYSSERKLIPHADLWAALLHAGASRDTDAIQYRLGLGYAGTPFDPVGLQLGWDRTITWYDADLPHPADPVLGNRFQATLGLRLTQFVLLALEGTWNSHIRDADSGQVHDRGMAQLMVGVFF